MLHSNSRLFRWHGRCLPCSRRYCTQPHCNRLSVLGVVENSSWWKSNFGLCCSGFAFMYINVSFVALEYFISSRGIPCVHFQPSGIGWHLSLTDDQMSSAVPTALTVVMVTTPLYFRPKAASCLRRVVFSLAYLSRHRSHLRLMCVHIQPSCTPMNICSRLSCAWHTSRRWHRLSSKHLHDRVCAWILYSCMYMVSLMAQIRKVKSQRGPHQPRPAQPLIVYALRGYDTCADRHVYTRLWRTYALKHECFDTRAHTQTHTAHTHTQYMRHTLSQANNHTTSTNLTTPTAKTRPPGITHLALRTLLHAPRQLEFHSTLRVSLLSLHRRRSQTLGTTCIS